MHRIACAGQLHPAGHWPEPFLGAYCLFICHLQGNVAATPPLRSPRAAPAGITKAQAIAGLRAHGEGRLADIFAAINLTPGIGVDFNQLGRVLTRSGSRRRSPGCNIQAGYAVTGLDAFITTRPAQYGYARRG